MRNLHLAVVAGFSVLLLAGSGCSRKEVSQTVEPAKLQMFAVLPDVVRSPAGGLTDARIALGRMLYYEPRLSRNQKISCNSCHLLDKYGVDSQSTSDGHKGQKGDRNAPTVYNAAGHFVQFWDGRAPDVEAQAKGPVMNPVEMAMPSEKQVLAVLRSMPGYVQAFKKAFPDARDPVSFDNMAIAVGAFERKLLTPSRWDKFLGGDQAALTPEEKAGFNTFVSAGCATCHAGAYVGGNLYQKLGLLKPYPEQSDPGRYQVTKSESDRMFFKVPSLRNIEKTGPYFHTGKVVTLEQAVAHMGDYQLGKQLSSTEVKSIITWLRTLTGEIPGDYIKAPALPEATAATPKAELD